MVPEEELDNLRQELLGEEEAGGGLHAPHQEAGGLAGDEDPAVACHHRLGDDGSHRRLANFSHYLPLVYSTGGQDLYKNA